jgi:hypothetical protein
MRSIRTDGGCETAPSLRGNYRIMHSAISSLIVAASLLTGDAPQPEAKYGYLWYYHVDAQGQQQKTVVPYEPHEGDVIFFDDQSKFWEFLYWIGHTAPPFHTGLVVKKPDGTLSVLESGPDDTLHVYIFEASERLHTFKGIVQVRRCKVPLTPEQSCKLTEFALAQEGKRYAMWRLLLQGTPIKLRGGPCRCAMAGTWYKRQRWLCTEIVVAGAELVGLMDPHVIKACNTYPLDLVDERMFNLLPVYEEIAYWCTHP